MGAYISVLESIEMLFAPASGWGVPYFIGVECRIGTGGKNGENIGPSMCAPYGVGKVKLPLLVAPVSDGSGVVARFVPYNNFTHKI